MKKLTLYEEALCCSTGVCGPSVDEDLLRITGVMQQVEETENAEMARYNLASSPDAFVGNQDILDIIHKNGKKSLPITVLDGEVVKTGAYPTNEEIEEYLDIQVVEETV